MHARWSQCCNKVNTVVDYCAVEVYLHAFFAAALDEDYAVNFKVRRIIPFQKGLQVRTEIGALNDKQKERIGQEEFLSHYLWEPNQVHPERMIVNIYLGIRRIQT